MRRSLIGLATTFALGFSLVTPARAAGPASAHHARGTAGVFWFMHLSDLHTSCDWNPTNEHKNMQLAFGPAVQVIKPWFLAATGDLVDGSPFAIPTTGQSQAEWDEYKGLYTAAGFTPSFFHDIPGNHDGYGDVGFSYYLANSMQGSTNKSTYQSWNVDTPLGNYRFIGLGSAGKGSGPFSEQPEFLPEQIASMQADLAASPAPELVFVLAHHPITTPKNSSQVIDLMKGQGGGFYLHGHVHEYGEYVDGDPTIVANKVDTLGQSGDDNIAVGVVDHNAFVYRATGVNQPWPLVIVTAPVSRTLRDGEPNPWAYEVCKDRVDNPMRALVFAESKPSAVTVQVGLSKATPMSPDPQEENLWVADVDTTQISAGPNDVTVKALVGGLPASHTISAEFVEGPCAALPDDALLDGGSDAGADAGGAGGAAGEAGSGGAGIGAAGSGASASTTGTGGAAGAPASATPAEEESGCSCRGAGSASRSGSAAFVVLGALALALALRRRGLRVGFSASRLATRDHFSFGPTHLS